MSSTAERFALIADHFAERIANVPAHRWEDPSPCPPWTARDVVDHVVDGCGFFLTATGRPLTVPADAPPADRWAEAQAAMADALADPTACATRVASPVGELAFKQVVGGVLLHDVLVHTWDLARATGQDERLDPATTEAALAKMAPFDEYLRGPAMFGPRLEVTDDADVQTRFLAFVGRTTVS